MKAMDNSEAAVKSLLEKIAAKAGGEWHAQETHKIAVAVYWLDLLEIKDQTIRDAALNQWKAVPGGFGTNASQLAQKLGREKKAERVKAAFAGF